jgi:hypothetical protein
MQDIAHPFPASSEGGDEQAVHKESEKESLDDIVPGGGIAAGNNCLEHFMTGRDL